MSDVTKPKPKTKLTLTERSLTNEQLLSILQKTPANHIYKRPGKGGGTWEYVTGTYVKKVLNYVFGWNWDFEVKEHMEKGGTICVLGRLTINANNMKIVKEQWGRADIKKNRTTGDYLDYGNDLKAATTDALKKCASELGIASDIYGAEEFKEINKELIAELPDPKEPVLEEGSAENAPVLKVLDPIGIGDELIKRREVLKQGGENVH
jgi:hypothetical protein